MKKFSIAVLLALGLLCSSGSLFAQEAGGQVPGASLQQLGLGGMQSMSDEQGMQVRAKFILQVNLLFVFRPSINIQQNVINGVVKTVVVVRRF
ncbi:MAG TPA: hypothetical protein VFE24_11725 [Pirellulales bacterium]|jgi:hypothetical protein|nr:hypothetical protein [Pirellulales bacterium]